MTYLIVYKTDEYKDEIAKNIKETDDIFHVEEREEEIVIYSVANTFKIIRCAMIDEMDREQKFHNIILEDGCYDLLTEYQLALLEMQNIKWAIFLDKDYLN